MKFPEKRRVHEKLIAAMSSTLAQMAQAAEEVRRDATHEEAKPENDKDTRALEQTYLARGQAIRAEALVDELKVLQSMALPIFTEADVIRSGALIALEEEKATRCVFLAPYGGGTAFEIDGTTVMVVTPVSALGRALLGKRVGDDVEVRVRQNVREYSIAAIV